MNYNKIYSSLAARLNNEATHFTSARLNALELLNLHGWPTSKNEKYKYTKPQDLQLAEKLIKPENLLSCSEVESLCHSKWSDLSELDAYYFYFHNGYLVSEQQNVDTFSLNWLSKQNANASKYNLLAAKEYDAPTALNSLLWQGGILLEVPEGKKVVKPIVLLNWIDAEADELVLMRNLMLFAPQAEAQVVLINLGVNKAYQSNTVNELHIGSASKIDFIRLQNEADSSKHINADYVEQATESLFNCTTLAIGSGTLRNSSQVTLVGQKAENHLYGLVIGTNKQHIDNYTFVDHAVPNCLSNELYKSVVGQQAVSVFNGRILVQPDAQKTLAFQSNRNILLSDTAKVYTKPQLEIYADDVKCSHGATIGQPDSEALFYMQSRGIGVEQARLLLISGFVGEVLNKVSNNYLHSFLVNTIEQKLKEAIVEL